MKPPKITIVCIGRFHLFNLARELLKRNMLKAIFTGYPQWKLKDEDIPSSFIQTFPWLQTPYMALAKWKLLGDGRFQRDLFWQINETLDRYVAKNLPESEVLFALSGSGLRCGQLMQRRGCKYICDRGSSHIRYQDSILRDEYKRWGEFYPGIDKRIIEKEEAEYQAADLVTVPSTFAYQSFLERGFPNNKVCMVPYGVDTRHFEKVATPDSEHFNVLYVGQISFRKGIPYLLKAFNNLKHPKKRLFLAGTICIEMARYLKQRHLSSNVTFLGHIPQRDLKHIMSKSHVMVLPSIEDGFGLVLAQAMACGCPVISTENTGARDLFADGKEGFIVPIRTPRAIAEKLQLLVDAPDLRARMGTAAIKRTADMAGWSEYGRHITTTFHQLMGICNCRQQA